MKKKMLTRMFAGLFCVSLVMTSLDSVVYADSAVESSQAEQTPEQSGSADGQSETDGQNVVDLQSESGTKDGSVLSTESNEKGGTEVAGTETNDTESETEKGTEKDTETEKTTEAENAEETTEADKTDKGAIDYEALKSRIDALPSVADLESGKSDAAEANKAFGALVDALYDYELIDESASEFTLTEDATKELGTDRVEKIKSLSEYFSNATAAGNNDETTTPAETWVAPTADTINIGTSGITNPATPNENTAWKGSYVYFGSYDADKDGKISTSEYVKYRVLAPETTAFSADGTTSTMLLDSDSVLWTAAFDADTTSNETGKNPNEWAISDIYKSLNTGETSFLQNSFSTLERNSIAGSVKQAAAAGDGEGRAYVVDYAALTGEKIFLLDAVEATNESYGYSNTSLKAANRVKNLIGGEASYWWFRSPYISYTTDAAYAYSDGDINDGFVNYKFLGVSPALNIDLSTVLLSSASGLSKTSVLSADSSKIDKTQVTDWKLTVLDEEKSVSISDGKNVFKTTDGTIIVPYTYSDTTNSGVERTDAEKANQISVMITDTAYDATGAKVLYYGKLDTGTTLSTSGKGTFKLPSALNGQTLGTDYHVYLLAEHTTDTNATDYASAPVEITSISNVWEAPTVNTINIGTTGIVAPSTSSTSGAWTGSYVYFGTYDADGDGTADAVKYRVLAPETTAFSADGTTKTMLLDSDSILWAAKYDADGKANESGKAVNEWSISDIYKSLNTGKTSFLQTSFSTSERNAIAESTKKAATAGDGNGGLYHNSSKDTTYFAYTALNGEKVFILDAAEATNADYGYDNTYIYTEAQNRGKNVLGGSAYAWWLRSPYVLDDDSYVGYVYPDGTITGLEVDYYELGVSPALNIDLSTVLFSSAIGTNKTTVLSADSSKVNTTQVTDWKLTLLDKEKSVGISDGNQVSKASDGTITVPYTYSEATNSGIERTDAEKVNQISVMITDAAYDATGAKVLYYGKLDTGSTLNTKGTGTFKLPSALNGQTLGTDYHVYLLAEHTTDTNKTDYASAPVEITSIKQQASQTEVPASSSTTTNTNTSVAVVSGNDTGITTTGNTNGITLGIFGGNSANKVNRSGSRKANSTDDRSDSDGGNDENVADASEESNGKKTAAVEDEDSVITENATEEDVPLASMNAEDGAQDSQGTNFAWLWIVLVVAVAGIFAFIFYKGRKKE